MQAGQLGQDDGARARRRTRESLAFGLLAVSAFILAFAILNNRLEFFSSDHTSARSVYKDPFIIVSIFGLVSALVNFMDYQRILNVQVVFGPGQPAGRPSLDLENLIPR